MIELFDYLTIFLTLLYTAAVLRVIGGISAASNKENRYSVHLILISVSFLSIVFSFWTSWGMKETDWTLPKLLFALVDPAIAYFIATVLIPENPNEIKSWKEYYYKNKNKYFIATLIYIIYIQFHGTILFNQPIFHISKLAALIALIPIIFGLQSSNHKVHLSIAIFYLLQILIMSFTIAVEPGWTIK